MNSEEKKWFEISEVSTNHPWHFRFMLAIAKYLPRWIVLAITAIISFFFFLGAKAINQNSSTYFKKLGKINGKKYTWFDNYKHILCFSISMMERLYCFMGHGTLNDLQCFDDTHELEERLKSGKGALILCSHEGNMESFRSLKKNGPNNLPDEMKIVPVADYSGTSHFNNLLRELDPDLMNNIIDANSIGPDTVIYIKNIVEHCGIVIIAADRISANTKNRTTEVDFLGEKALLPEGAFTLASIIGVPIFMGFGIRKKDFSLNSTYELHLHKLKTQFPCSRSERKDRIQNLAQEYANLEAKYCLKHPYQWYNFFNFWKKSV